MTNAISWMMAGGLPDDLAEDRRRREHLVHLRDLAAMQDRRSFGLPDASAFVARLSERLGTLTSTTTASECCAA